MPVPGDVARVRHEVEDDVPEMVLSCILDDPFLEFTLVTPAEGEARHLPQPDAGGTRLLRVYLAVDSDYTENRVGALSAHVSSATGLPQ